MFLQCVDRWQTAKKMKLFLEANQRNISALTAADLASPWQVLRTWKFLRKQHVKNSDLLHFCALLSPDYFI